MNDHATIAGIARDSVPRPRPDVIEWAESEVVLPASVRSQRFDCSITPWLREPFRVAMDPAVKVITLVKPIQTGGSTFGEVMMLYWINFFHGMFQFNWPDDDKANLRWKTRLKKILESCPSVASKIAQIPDDDYSICEVDFGNMFLNVQGVFSPNHLDSDSIPFQINEEVHAWKPGHLPKARGRQTAVWNPKALDISNAGLARPKNFRGDAQGSFQLHDAYEEGSKQLWTVKCPGCGEFHSMRARWEDSRPELGGLRYDSAQCIRADGTIDYHKLASTLRYQFPCQYSIYENDIRARRALSLGGKYSDPAPGSDPSHRSFTYESVAVDFVPWTLLVKEKQSALRAMRAGDSVPWSKYIMEREARFYSEDSRPFSGQIILNRSQRKTVKGLEGRFARFWWSDKQKGYVARGEMPHYWLVVRDVMPNCDSMLVWEGLLQTDSDLVGKVRELVTNAGGVDATWDRQNVLQFCWRNEFHAITGSAQREWFFHKKENARHPWGETEGIHKLLGVRPRYNYVLQQSEQKVLPGKNPSESFEYVPDAREPRHWAYHKVGIMKLLFFLRDHERAVRANSGDRVEPGSFIKWEVPGDVSEDYKNQMESWEIETVQSGKSKDTVEQFKKVREADHMLMCESYIAMLMAMSGVLSTRLDQLGAGKTILQEA